MQPAATGPHLMTRAAPTGPLLSRRQFLWWSAALGAATALRLPCSGGKPAGLGLIGLGGRGAAALALCRSLPEVHLVALCDRDPAVLQRLAAGGSAAADPPLLTREPAHLLRHPAVAAVVLAAAGAEQLALALAAAETGKHVLLLRPWPLDSTSLRELAARAGLRHVQVHVARAHRFALASQATRAVVGTGHGAGSAVVQTRLRSPRLPEAAELLHELVDEADFAEAVLGGTIVRSLAVGGPGCLPGRWMDRRLHLDLEGQDGRRRALTLALTADRGAPGQASAKESRIVVRGSRGAAHLAAVPVAGCDPLDLRAFLSAVRSGQPGPGLTLPRLLHLHGTVLADIPP